MTYRHRAGGGCLRGARILLVEDNAINQEIARDLLGRSGIVVTVVEDGQQAINILVLQSFDGVLMDYQMSVMDGYAATAILRRQERLRDLPIIAMTANARWRSGAGPRRRHERPHRQAHQGGRDLFDVCAVDSAGEHGPRR